MSLRTVVLPIAFPVMCAISSFWPGALKSRAKSHSRKRADGSEVFDIGRTKRMIRFHGSRGNQGISQLDSVGEGMFFDDRGRSGVDAFGERQYTKPQLAERLPDLAGFQLRGAP